MEILEYNKWLARKDIEYRNSELYFADLNMNKIAEEYGTPVYVLNEMGVRKRYKELKDLLNSVYKKNSIHYAVKANSNLAILRILKSEGAHFDCTSKGEIFFCLKAGIPPEKILFTGNMLSDEDLEYAVNKNVKINLDSLSQLDRLIKIQEKLNKQRDLISFRINPEFGAGHHVKTITAGKDIKFGILEHQVMEAYEKAISAGFKKFGIHQHIGSGIINANDFRKAVEKYLDIVLQVKKKLDIQFKFVDFGGGLGIPYHPDQDPLDLELYKRIIIKKFKDLVEDEDLGEPNLFIEPGRYLVAESEILISKITTIKNNGYKIFVGLDAGFHTLIRPAMYGSYHHIIPCADSGKKKIKYDIVGPLCESGDILGKDRTFPKLKEGEYLSILDVGAYGYSMSSTYNVRPKPAELLIESKNVYKVRKPQPLEDLLEHQELPDHLK
ncbi:MAG: Diaminopimelate decarboxylase [Promethearchaeota archaeon]|nr:MAG: Diaminopimelate decarboxylase [Candidatus Lokiarchaeota archaeon]